MNRKYLLLIALTLLCVSVKAQDTIILMTGEELIVRVREVSDAGLKYQLWDNQDGPLYNNKTSSIFMVKYHNGRREMLSQKTKQGQNNFYYKDMGHLDLSFGNLEIDGNKLSDDEIIEILGEDGFQCYSSAISQWRKGKHFIFGGLGCLVGGIASICVGYYVGHEYYILIPIGELAIIASQIEFPIGFALKGIGNGRANWVVDDYNSSLGYSENYSVKLAPTALYTQTSPGKKTWGVGAKLSFNF